MSPRFTLKTSTVRKFFRRHFKGKKQGNDGDVTDLTDDPEEKRSLRTMENMMHLIRIDDEHMREMMKVSHAHSPPPSLGVIRLDYDYEAAPGDIDHPGSYGYKVYYRVVPGLTFEMCQSGKMTPAVERDFKLAIEFLVRKKHVNIITGDCGFMFWFQELASTYAMDVPVCLSALGQLPTLVSCMSHHTKIVIMTANQKSLEPMLDLIHEKVGLDIMHDAESRFVLVGCEDVPFFGQEVARGEKVCVEKAQPGILALAKRALQDHPTTRAFLMECTELPPYSDAVRRETGLPVFDSITAADSFVNSLLDNSRFGDNDWQEQFDGRQEPYRLGQHLSDDEVIRCQFCQMILGERKKEKDDDVVLAA